MGNDLKQPATVKERAVRRGEESLGFRISLRVTVVLIPFLVLLIVVSCILSVRSISSLNDKLLDVQTDYAVSIVDDFFSSKLAVVSMFENNDDLQAYFQAVSVPQDIEGYEDREKIQELLSMVLEKMGDEMVAEAWAADARTDRYLLSGGEGVEAGLKDTVWYEPVLSGREPFISDTYRDPATGEQIVSVVAPVFFDNGQEAAGFMGVDVYVSNLSELLSGIKVGERGYLELISNRSDYIYSEDPTAMGRNVTELDISDDYKNKVQANYNGVTDFSYGKIRYTAMFRNSRTTNWLALATLPVSEINATRNQLIAVMAFLSILILAALVVLIISMIRRITRPLADISGRMQDFSRGDLRGDIQVWGKDEIGRLADSIRSSTRSLKDMIGDISHILEEISGGNLDLRVKGTYIGDFRFIKEALERIVQSLNETLGQIGISAEQVSNGSEQVAAGAQALAQGAAEQAGTVEELAVSIGEISRQITANADSAADASQRAEAVGREAAESNRRMQDMLAAMQEIRSGSREISKIIKTIEDIAFQTNILALNAAVEAARVGEAGKGFAVVAGEVRNLATKSAEASRNTADLINGSMRAVENGTRIADHTARSMQNVEEGVRIVVGAVEGISVSTSRQAESVTQLSQGIEQISNVVQVNSATAEESAAASEELSAQAMLLRELIERFQLRGNTSDESELAD